MDQVTRVCKHLKKEQWKKIITECRASGMTVTSWCKVNGIVEQTYYNNLKKLREEMCNSLPVPISDSEEKTIAFKKLEVQTPIHDTQAAVIIHLPSASLEIQNGATQQTVEAVLLALKNIC